MPSGQCGTSLTIPHPFVYSTLPGAAACVARTRRIFVNRSLKLCLPPPSDTAPRKRRDSRRRIRHSQAAASCRRCLGGSGIAHPARTATPLAGWGRLRRHLPVSPVGTPPSRSRETTVPVRVAACAPPWPLWDTGRYLGPRRISIWRSLLARGRVHSDTPASVGARGTLLATLPMPTVPCRAILPMVRAAEAGRGSRDTP